MPKPRTETPEQALRRNMAQADKAWKLIHALRATWPNEDNDFLIDVLSLMDDQEWEKLRLATHGPIKPHKGNDTSCTVSQQVKAKVYRILRNPESLGIQVAEPGEDAMAPRRLRVIK